jgi:hypothetical protein
VTFNHFVRLLPLVVHAIECASLTNLNMHGVELRQDHIIRLQSFTSLTCLHFGIDDLPLDDMESSTYSNALTSSISHLPLLQDVAIQFSDLCDELGDHTWSLPSLTSLKLSHAPTRLPRFDAPKLVNVDLGWADPDDIPSYKPPCQDWIAMFGEQILKQINSVGLVALPINGRVWTPFNGHIRSLMLGGGPGLNGPDMIAALAAPQLRHVEQIQLPVCLPRNADYSSLMNAILSTWSKLQSLTLAAEPLRIKENDPFGLGYKELLDANAGFVNDMFIPFIASSIKDKGSAKSEPMYHIHEHLSFLNIDIQAIRWCGNWSLPSLFECHYTFRHDVSSHIIWHMMLLLSRSPSLSIIDIQATYSHHLVNDICATQNVGLPPQTSTSDAKTNIIASAKGNLWKKKNGDNLKACDDGKDSMDASVKWTFGSLTQIRVHYCFVPFIGDKLISPHLNHINIRDINAAESIEFLTCRPLLFGLHGDVTSTTDETKSNNQRRITLVLNGSVFCHLPDLWSSWLPLANRVDRIFLPLGCLAIDTVEQLVAAMSYPRIKVYSR